MMVACACDCIWLHVGISGRNSFKRGGGGGENVKPKKIEKGKTIILPE